MSANNNAIRCADFVFNLHTITIRYAYLNLFQCLCFLFSRSFEETELDEIMTAKWEQGWLRLNVSQAFRHWIKRPSHNFGLVISTKSADSGKSYNKGLNQMHYTWYIRHIQCGVLSGDAMMIIGLMRKMNEKLLG